MKDDFEHLTIFLLRAMWMIQISVILLENKDCYSTKKTPHLIFQSSKFKSKSHLCKSKKVHNHKTNLYQSRPVCLHFAHIPSI